MARILEKLRIHEVSSVTRGAGEGVKVMLMKLAGMKPTEKADDFNTAMAASETAEYANEMIEEFGEALCALQTAVWSIMYDDALPDKKSALDETFGQFKAHVAGIVPEGMEKAMRGAALAAAAQSHSAQGALAKGNKAMTDDEKAAAAVVTKRADDAEAALAKAMAELNLIKMSKEHSDFADASGMSADAKATFAAKSASERDAHIAANPVKKAELPAEVTKALSENVEMKKRLADLEAKDALVAFKKQAVDLGLGEAHGETLQKAYAGDKAGIDALVQLTKAAAEQARVGGVFKEFGTAHGNATAGGGALAQLKTKAEELRKVNTTLTIEQAFAKVYADPANMALMRQERQEAKAA